MIKSCSAALALLFLSLLPETCAALYQHSGEGYGLQVNGLFSAGLGAAVYPDNSLFGDQVRELLWNGDLRLMGEYDRGDDLRGTVNILQNYRAAHSFGLIAAGAGLAADVERSGIFYLQQHDSTSTHADLVLDVGRIAYGDSLQELVIGRQPISLSVTFYFTPNDFFAPFGAQDFYRVYKPGVDAVRYERRLANLSQLSFVGVLGYERDFESDSGWSDAPDWQRTSLAGRWVRNITVGEIGFLGGLVRETAVIGTSFQGELFQWLGIRAEGHYFDGRQGEMQSGVKVSVGLEHRFASSLTLRLEQMYNGAGYDTIDDADSALHSGTLRPGYLGRNYTAFDISYEFTPLLIGEFLYLRNWTDQSQLFSVYAVLSLSDESELAFTLGLPTGSEPDAGMIHSELGSQPVRCTLEYRLYF